MLESNSFSCVSKIVELEVVSHKYKWQEYNLGYIIFLSHALAVVP